MTFRFTALLLMLSTFPLAAHHSVVATYDSSKVMTLTGKVTEVIWRNPHTSLSMSVTGAEGKVVMWKIEMGGSAVLFKPGFRKEDIFSSSITLQVWPARDGSPTAAGRLLTLPDGRQFDVHDTFAENVPTK
jgi:hypothetical protein